MKVIALLLSIALSAGACTTDQDAVNRETLDKFLQNNMTEEDPEGLADGCWAVSLVGEGPARPLIKQGLMEVEGEWEEIEDLFPGWTIDDFAEASIDWVFDFCNSSESSTTFKPVTTILTPSEITEAGSCIVTEVDMFDDIQVRFDLVAPVSGDLMITYGFYLDDIRFADSYAFIQFATEGEVISYETDSFTSPGERDPADIECRILEIEQG